METGPGRPKLAAGNIVIVIPTPGTAPTVDSVTGDGVTDVGVEGVEGVEGVVVAVDDDYVTLSVVVADARALAAMIATGPLVVAMKGR